VEPSYRGSNRINLAFLCGLPRSGSTWLGVVLNQNPDCYVTVQSPFVELLWRNYSLWEDSKWAQDFIGDDSESKKISYLKGITELYYRQLTNCNLVIDNRRQWQSIGNIRMYTDIFGELPKIICPVRNVEEIVASFSNLFKKNNREFRPESNLEGNVFSDTYYQLKSTYDSIYRDCLHIIDYDDLVANTDLEVEKIYKFLNIQSYKSNYETMKGNPLYKDIDTEYDLIGMHDIKSGVHKSETNPEEVLSEDQLKKFKELTFW
jgi:hypothetical protein